MTKRISRITRISGAFHEEYTRPVRDAHSVLQQFANSLPDHPSCLKFALLLKHREYKQLIEWEVDPLHYQNADDFRLAYLCASMLSKYADIDVGIDKEAVAVKKWREAEESCRLTNECFRLRAEGKFNFSPSVERVLVLAQRKVSQILGPLKSSDAINLASFGPGADLGTTRGLTSPYHKMVSSGHITIGCLKHITREGVLKWPIFEMMKTGTGLPNFELAPGNRLAFVPKNARTDRSISVEPRWNIFFQKGYGQLIRRKLKYAGIDLDDQTRNQALSRRLDLATIDLSSASDTISWHLVLDLLPLDWFDALDHLRSPQTVWKKTPIELEKFSSMGNGYTFELESLIFYSIAFAVVKDLGLPVGDVSVYGDDIIVPVGAFDALDEVLRAVGFTLNKRKSFGSGLFRESCGAHWFNGFSVTPFYVKKGPTNVERLVGFANKIRRFAHKTFGSDGCDRRFLFSYNCVVRQIPPNLRVRGPMSISSCLAANLDEYCPPRHRFFDAWVVTIPVFVPNPMQADMPALLYEKLLQPSSSKNSVVVRSRGRWKLTKAIVHDHRDLGLWLD